MLKYKSSTTQDFLKNPTNTRALDTPFSVITWFDSTGGYSFYNTDGWGAPNIAQSAITVSNFYTYNATEARWYFSAVNQRALSSINTYPYDTGISQARVTFDLLRSAVSGNQESGNFDPGIYVVVNHIQDGVNVNQAQVGIAIQSYVIVRKLLDLQDNILYEKTSKSEVNQFDELSLLWSSTMFQYNFLQFTYDNYDFSTFANINAFLEAVVAEPELEKLVVLFSKCMSIATKYVR
jgi:hypothetical protein